MRWDEMRWDEMRWDEMRFRQQARERVMTIAHKHAMRASDFNEMRSEFFAIVKFLVWKSTPFTATVVYSICNSPLVEIKYIKY